MFDFRNVKVNDIVTIYVIGLKCFYYIFAKYKKRLNVAFLCENRKYNNYMMLRNYLIFMIF